MRRLLYVAGLGLCLSGCSMYSSGSPGASPRTVSRAPVAIDASVFVSLTAEQARIVRAHIAGTSVDTRGRNGRLPPGIEKNLSRGKPVPPGIAKQYLPTQITRSLPPLPAGFEYLVVAGKLLLVEAATQIIRDVLLDAVV